MLFDNHFKQFVFVIKWDKISRFSDNHLVNTFQFLGIEMKKKWKFCFSEILLSVPFCEGVLQPPQVPPHRQGIITTSQGHYKKEDNNTSRRPERN